MKHISSLVIACLLLTTVHSQDTWPQVYQLLSTNCAGSGCHSGGNAYFNLTGNSDSAYTALMNVAPQNAAAVAKGNKLVIAGDVQRSFLLRKIAHGISDGLAIDSTEGLAEPNGLPKLADNQIELVRQWILYGAPKTGNVVDTALINTYYRDGGIDDTYSPHTAPSASQGFQIYYGRIFLPKNTETELFYKYAPNRGSAIEVNKVETMMPQVDHHFGIWIFQQGQASHYGDGIRPLAQGSMEDVQYGIGTAAGLWEYTLPHNTAFFFPQTQTFDLDLHIQNPSTDSILSTDLYVNLYTQPVGTATKYMQVMNYPNTDISIPQDGQSHTFTVTCTDSSQTQYWNIWKLYTHTHKYGTAFNVWMRNPDGSKGAQVYNGNYSYEQGFDVGFYRWGPHVTFRTWPDDSLLVVDPRLGLIGEAVFKNTAGPDPVNWGFSSADEMMDVGFYYLAGADLPATTGIQNVSNADAGVKVFPNPTNGTFIVSYEINQPTAVQVDLIDVMGNRIANLVHDTPQAIGKYTHDFNTNEYKLAAGIYLVKFTIGEKETSARLIVTE